MEPTSLPKQASKPRDIIEGQLRDCYGRAVYSHKTHEKCADLLQGREAKLKLTQIVLSAISTAGLIGTIFGQSIVATLALTGLSTALLVLNSYMKNHEIGGLAFAHKQAAQAIWLVREEYLSLIADLRSDQKTASEILKIRDDLLHKLHAAYVKAPPTNYKAYSKAQEALQKSEELTFSDSEIDALLPIDLRRSKTEE